MSKSVADSATAALRELLARGAYQPGDRLPAERELAAGLGLSRPTLREAIRRLTEAGLLEARRGSGTYVADVDLDAVFAVRARLEPFAAELAARNRDPADVERLSGLLAQLRRAIDEPDAFAELDAELHRTIAHATHNPVLVTVLAQLAELTKLSRAITSPELRARKAALRDLKTLVGAVRAGDEAAASTAMQAHLAAMAEIAARSRPRDRRIVSADRA